jgi:hypothetical protein
VWLGLTTSIRPRRASLDGGAAVVAGAAGGPEVVITVVVAIADMVDLGRGAQATGPVDPTVVAIALEDLSADPGPTTG